jgi:hypothetical protein
MRWLFLFLTLLGLAGCSPRMDVVNEARAELISPDERYRIVVFSREGGATTSTNTHASLLGKSEPLPADHDGNFLILDHAESILAWKPDGGILVEIPSHARVFKLESSIRGIRVEHREK